MVNLWIRKNLKDFQLDKLYNTNSRQTHYIDFHFHYSILCKSCFGLQQLLRIDYCKIHPNCCH